MKYWSEPKKHRKRHGSYSQPNTPIKWLRKKMVCVLVSDDVSSRSRFRTFRGLSGRYSRESTPPSAGAGAHKREAGHAVEAETEQRSRRRAWQSIREYELMLDLRLLQQRLRAVSWPHRRLRCMHMQPLLGHGMGVVRP